MFLKKERYFLCKRMTQKRKKQKDTRDYEKITGEHILCHHQRKRKRCNDDN